MAVLLRRLVFVFILPVIYCDWWEDLDDTSKLVYTKYLRRIADYPHVVAMVDISQPSERLVCVGLHIGTTPSNLGVVLTAGSCVYLLEKNHIRQNSTVIRSNSEHWNCHCGLSEEYKIQEWLLHPQYTEYDIPFVGKFSENDVGLLVIDDEWRGAYNVFAKVHPLKMPLSWEMGEVQIIGWGFESTAIKTLQELRIGETLTIISGESCRQRYYTEFFPVNSYCIQQSVELNTKKSCNYDNGGPVVIAGNDTKGTFEYKVVGTIVKTSRCNNFSKPTIVVNTSRYQKFITDFSWVKSNNSKHHSKEEEQEHEHKYDLNNSQENNENNSDYHGHNDDYWDPDENNEGGDGSDSKTDNDDDHLDDSKENNRGDSNENSHKKDNDDDHLDDSKENNRGNSDDNNHKTDNDDDHLDDSKQNDGDDPNHQDDNDDDHLDDSKENHGGRDKSGDHDLKNEARSAAGIASVSQTPNQKNAAVQKNRKSSNFNHHGHIGLSSRPNTGYSSTKHTSMGGRKNSKFVEHGVGTWKHKFVTGWQNGDYQVVSGPKLYGLKEGDDSLPSKRGCYPTSTGWQRCFKG